MPRAPAQPRDPSTTPVAAAAAAATSSTAAPATAPGASDTYSRVPPLAPLKPFEPLEHQVGQDHERTMNSEGPATQALDPAYFETVDPAVDMERVAELGFNEDVLEVQIHTTNEKDAEDVFEVTVNGRSEFFRRGETKKCRRKVVERLARAKITTFTQERRTGPDGEFFDVQIPKTALRYPFAVLHDPHPRGRDWLASILAQP